MAYDLVRFLRVIEFPFVFPFQHKAFIFFAGEREVTIRICDGFFVML